MAGGLSQTLWSIKIFWPLDNSRVVRADSLKQLVLGGVLIVVGLALVVFRKAIRRADDNWNKRVPWPLQTHGPSGDSFEGFLILFGVFVLLVGIINLILPFLQQ
jgi:uncharacterized membrane protein HdeD (DUF308 family)